MLVSQAVRSPLPKRSAWLLGCSETQSTSGQTDNPKVPHGFSVLALCEALRGNADTDHDGLVRIRPQINYLIQAYALG